MDDPSTAFRLASSLVLLAAGTWLGPRVLVGREAHAFFDDDRATDLALADSVAGYVEADVGTSAFHTGSARFDGEWALGTHQMALLGLAQVSLAHPDLTPRHLPAMRSAADVLVDPDTYAFGRDAWDAGPLDDLEGGHGHAYLGYAALALGALREVDPQTPHAALHDRIVSALAARLAASPFGIVETYPGEAYPCDIASIAGAIGQHDRLTGGDHHALLAREAEIYRERFVDPRSGYLYQAVDPRSGEPRDGPRGSGTALGAYFWSFADRALAAELDRALLEHGHVELAGFGGVLEHPDGAGGGDIDSGPVVLGLSVSATGFTLAAARRAGDRDAFASLYRTTALFGAPVPHDDGTRFLSGGPLGNAILLAMLTARPS